MSEDRLRERVGEVERRLSTLESNSNANGCVTIIMLMLFIGYGLWWMTHVELGLKAAGHAMPSFWEEVQKQWRGERGK